MSNSIDIQADLVDPQPETPQQTQAVAVRQAGGAVRIAMTLDQIGERLDFMRRVMREQMKEGQDYGKIPGTGDKPSLLQPGAQKLLMTFNLREQIKKEVLREYPNWHREYEITVTVFPSGQPPENGWDGVGTCSTLESKYRYRKAERKCPVCGKTAIIKGKEEYGGGFVCFKKKHGCGAKFGDDDPRILSQPADDVENDDPADVWNTVRKMAFKRALVAAAINATNTSELWTQDLEDMAANASAKTRQNPPGGAGSSATLPRQGPGPKTSATSQQQAPGGTKKAVATPETPFPSEATRKWFLDELQKTFPEHMQEVAEFFEKVGILLPNENLTDIPLRWVPNSRAQLRQVGEAIGAFAAGDEAKMPYPSHPEPGEPKKKAEPKKETAAPGTQEAEADSGPDSPDAPWRSFPMPWGKQAGVMLADLDKKYLFGLWANYEVETEYNGKPCKPEKIAKDREFRAMLDQAGLHYNFQKT